MSEYEKNLDDEYNRKSDKYSEESSEQESPAEEDYESPDIPENELDPESNPMKISGSKYLSKNAHKAVIGMCVIGIGILLSALFGAELFDDPRSNKKEEKNVRSSISDNTMSAEIINRNAGPESIIPANVDNGIIGEPQDDYPETEPIAPAQAVIQTQNGSKIQLLDPNQRLGAARTLPPPRNYQNEQTPPQQHVNDEFAERRKNERAKVRQSRIAMFSSSVTSSSKINVVYSKPVSQSANYTAQPPANASLEEKRSFAEQERARILGQMADINDPNGNYQQKIAAMRDGTTYQPGNSENNVTKFAITTASSTETGDKWTLNSEVKTPNTLSIITGHVIPATMITGVNSDLPGKLIAQVSHNVYDSPTGKYLLIPQGTKIFGKYDSGIIYGQERVLVSWNRLIFPDGKTIDIEDMSGTDQAGYSGMNDLVNNHYLRLFTSSFLLSVISAGVTYSQDKHTSNNENGTTASSAMAQSFGNQMGNTAIQMIQKNMNISPTLEIRPGFKINVMVTKDIIFTKPYQNYDY
ncbi:MAG: hypothetical protein II847_03485 [Ruminobacter sp.]|uniref:TrbI/VirB10 family protein n=1 Tax=Ruminobacter sp. TaxID=2774296 RepID=UPI00257ABA02|nr:TrbI/VirB10 family protein [Ruminobacter sp.]MBQ3775176.1 hypothetical protein [Ruminobacter sp.]